MRDDVEFDRGPKVRTIKQKRGQLAVIELKELFESQASEQLWLRELLRTEEVSVVRKGELAHQIGRLDHPLWRLRGTAHILATNESKLAAQC